MKRPLEGFPVFAHNNVAKTVWDILVTVVVFAAALLIPYRLYTGYHPFGFIYWLIKAVLALDLLLCFNTSVKVKREVFRTRSEIGKLYLKTWFLPDLLAAFPLAAVLSGTAASMPAPAGTKLLFALTLLTLIRLFKINRAFSSIRQTLNVNPSIMRLVIFGFWFALAAHFMALGWIELGGGDRTAPPFTRYLLALYWCITTIATIGYGDITPDRTSNLQLIYTMFVELLGVGTFGYIIANITSLVANLDAAKAGFVKKTEEIISLGQHNSWVSRSLGARENPCFSAQIRPERTIGVWSPLGSSPCGCPCNPWSKAKNSSLPRPAARSDNLSHIGRSGHTAEVCHFGPHIVPHSRKLKPEIRCQRAEGEVPLWHHSTCGRCSGREYAQSGPHSR